MSNSYNQDNRTSKMSRAKILKKIRQNRISETTEEKELEQFERSPETKLVAGRKALWKERAKMREQVDEVMESKISVVIPGTTDFIEMSLREAAILVDDFQSKGIELQIEIEKEPMSPIEEVKEILIKEPNPELAELVEDPDEAPLIIADKIDEEKEQDLSDDEVISDGFTSEDYESFFKFCSKVKKATEASGVRCKSIW